MRRRDFRLPAGQVAAKHHAAKFHSANAALKVKRMLITRLRQLEFPLRTNTEHYDL